MARNFTASLFSKKIFESRQDPVASSQTFFWRVIIMTGLAIFLTLAFLTLGILGYHYFAQLPWVESFLNASMILGGMGEIDYLSSSTAKIFAGIYALFSGLYFAVVIGVLFAPFVHRFYHKFHIDNDPED